MADEKSQQLVTEGEEEGRKSTNSNTDKEDEQQTQAEKKEFGTETETFEEKDQEIVDKTTEEQSEQQENADTSDNANTVEINENSNADQEEKPADGPETTQSEVAEDAVERSGSQQSTPAADQAQNEAEDEKKDEEKEDIGTQDTEEKGDEEQTVEEGDTGGDKEENKPADEEQPADTEQDKDKTETETAAGDAEGDETEAKTTEDDEPNQEETDIIQKTDEIVEGETAEKVPSPVPKSDTFDEGERTESPVAIGSKLSREPTPVRFDVREVTIAESIEPGTPDEGSVVDEEEAYEEEEEEEPQPEFDRNALIERYNAAITEREQMQQQNYALQHKLAEYFRKKKSDESRQDYDKNVTDQEQRYLKYMAQLEDLRKQETHEKENYRRHIEDWKDRCEDKKSRVDDERSRFMHFKKEVALNALNSRSGKPITPKDIEQYLSAENKKEADVECVRLENIKLKNKLKKKEQQLKSKEELAEGLHLIDFEQLKIENQTYNEKIEERNEELLKLRKKITSTVQVLTHLKEKLQFVQAENQIQKGNLRSVEAYVAQKRDILSRTKQARDALRIDNQRLRQNCGLLGNEPLLRDYEERKDEGDELRNKLESLKMEHAELTLNCNQVRRKIEQARNGGRA